MMVIRLFNNTTLLTALLSIWLRVRVLVVLSLPPDLEPLPQLELLLEVPPQEEPQPAACQEDPVWPQVREPVQLALTHLPL